MNADVVYQETTDIKSVLKNYLLKELTDTKLIFVLENIGKLPTDFDANLFTILLENKNPKIRYWAIKHLGKLSNTACLAEIKEIALTDKNTSVRREAVSTIGRYRARKNIDFLVKMLCDKDPKVVCQAIRGLLIFKGDFYVDNELRALEKHENETVRSIIHQKYFTFSSQNQMPHAYVREHLKNVVINADVLDVLPNIANDSIHLTFTSPPYYNARDYSIYPSYKAYLKFLESVFLEVYRITKEGRFLIVNTSPVIVPRISRAHSSKRYPIPFDIHNFLTTMGWEFIDDIIWLKPEYCVKNRIGGFWQHRKPLAYKPNTITEYVFVYRKQTHKLIDWNIKQYDEQTVNDSKVADGFETTNIWSIEPKSNKVHSAVFPEDLCKRVIEYYSFKNDLVFDPFAGSGTVGVVAKKLDRYFLLTEQDKTYFNHIKNTIEKDNLFSKDLVSFLTLEEFNRTII